MFRSLFKRTANVLKPEKEASEGKQDKAHEPLIVHTCVYKWKPEDGRSQGIEKVTFLPFEIENEKGLGSKWQFYLKWNESGDGIGVYLRASVIMPDPDDERSRKRRINSLVAQFSVKMSHPRNCSENYAKLSPPHDYMVERNWGFPQFADLRTLQQYVGVDGRITFTFSFFLTEEAIQKSENDLWKFKLEELDNKSALDCIQTVYNGVVHDKDNYDMTVVTNDDQNFPAHKIVLAARSAYFRNALEDMRNRQLGYAMERIANNDSRMEVKVNQPAAVMRIILCFAYFGHMRTEWLNPRNIPMETACEIVKASEEHELEKLKQFFVEFYPGLKNYLEESSKEDAVEEGGES